MKLTHTDNGGKASMVDVGGKESTVRTASARAVVRMNSQTLEKIKQNDAKKGDVLACARIAGIQGGKKTSELIPLCHNIPVDKIGIVFCFDGDDTLIITSFAKCEYKTGIEMEALTAAAVAALTVYDMCKSVDRGMVITEIRLLSKSGGKSGDYSRDD